LGFSDEEIIDFIRPAIAAGIIRSADKGTINPELYTANSDSIENQLDRIKRIKEIKPKKYQSIQDIDKKAAREIFSKLGTIINQDGTKARFPQKTAGKILVDQGFKTSSIVPYLKELYETALFAYDEHERNQSPRPDGSIHKPHPDVETYRSHVNKFIDENDNEYYIHFVTYIKKRAQKNKPKKDTVNEIHSTFISEVYLYEENPEGGRASQPTGTDNSSGESHPCSDINLAKFFNSVKENLSKDANLSGTTLYHLEDDFASCNNFISVVSFIADREALGSPRG
jgi:hypothetical protein